MEKLLAGQAAAEPEALSETEQMVTNMGQLLDSACGLSNRIKAVADDFVGEMPAELPTAGKEATPTSGCFLDQMGNLISGIEMAHSRASEMLERLESKF